MARSADGKPTDWGYRFAWIFGGAAWAWFFGQFVVLDFISARPEPSINVIVGIDLVALFLYLQALAKIVSSHSLAPQGYHLGSLRYYILFVNLALGPCLLLAAAATWGFSIGWAIVWGVCGIGSTTVAYYIGRPWRVAS